MFRPFQDPQLSLNAIQDEMNRMFERVWHGGVSTRPFDGQPWAPAIDLYEQEDRYTVYAELPGVCAESVEVSYLANSLTIRGEKGRPEKVAEGTPSLRSERRFGAFCRTVELPGGIDADRASAKCCGGVLEINVPKSASSRAKTIRVEVEEKTKTQSKASGH